MKYIFWGVRFVQNLPRLPGIQDKRQPYPTLHRVKVTLDNGVVTIQNKVISDE